MTTFIQTTPSLETPTTDAGTKPEVPCSQNQSANHDQTEAPTAPVAPDATAPVGFWHRPLEITRSNFLHKSLSDFSANIAVGCQHGCSFCYVPHVSTIKQGPKLATLGVADPSADWGTYVFLRPLDEKAFLASLKKAEGMK